MRIPSGAERRRRSGTFERYLTLWVALCIIAGIMLGQLFPAPFHALGRMNVAEVNIPVAVLIWLMIVPMLLKVDFGALHQVAEQWRGIAVTVGINWLVKPFSMALLGWLFIGWLFRPWLPPGQIDSYIAGPDPAGRGALHGHGVRLVEPDRRRSEFHAEPGRAQRHDHGLRLRADRRAAARPLGDHGAVADAVPVGRALHRRAGDRRAALAPRAAEPGRRGGSRRAPCGGLQPVSLVALLATLVLLFGFQGEQIVRQPLVIALLAVPIIIQVYLNAGIAYGLNRALGVPHNIACPSALIGASNFFELAVAAAIALFGFQSGAALATVVGVLVEVPVMLSVVHIVLRSRGWYDAPCRLTPTAAGDAVVTQRARQRPPMRRQSPRSTIRASLIASPPSRPNRDRPTILPAGSRPAG